MPPPGDAGVGVPLRRRKAVRPPARVCPYGVAALLVLALAACDAAPDRLEYAVVQTVPHDTAAYTQGLVVHGGHLYESTGRYGRSEIRRIDPASGEVLARRALGDSLFGEGLAAVDSVLVQLTWKEGVALVWDPESLEVLDTLRYEGEGWGLCWDGEVLWMSDGGAELHRRDPVTFERLGTVRVTRDGISVPSLNELECVGDDVWANVFGRDEVLRIDKATGRVTGVLDGYPLSLATVRAPDPGAVLNGIARDPASGALWMTGKLWGRLFRVELER